MEVIFRKHLLEAAMSRSILVTGASRGIGRAVAFHHAEQEGANLWLLGRDEKALRESADGVESRGGKAHVLLADVTDRDGLLRSAQQVSQLQAIVAAAGMAGDTPVDQASDEAFDRILAANVTGAWNTVRAFLPAMEAGGRIVFVSSVLGHMGVPRASAYVAAKHGVIGLAKSLALELLPKGIIVNAVAPGWVDTEMALARVQELSAQMGLDEIQTRQKLERSVPVGRFFAPAEIARAIAWMLDPANSTQIGQCLNLDGGVLQN